ncbi:MAG: ATPase, T2SS/T4P/T4SS family [Gemmatimonadota bacterium]
MTADSTKPWIDAWLGAHLRAAGVITAEHEPALLASTAATLWQATVALGIASNQDILALLSRRSGIGIAPPVMANARLASHLPEKAARELGIAPLGLAGHVLEIGGTNPFDLDLESKAAFAAGRRIRLKLTDPATLQVLQDGLYPRNARADELIQAVTLSEGEGLLREVAALNADSTPSVSSIQLVDAIIVGAIRARASDIHLEPHESTLGVRYRVDGTLQEVARLPCALHASMTSRLKILANLDIADRMRPQDGRAQLQISGRKIDLRISTLPVGTLGEKTVIRILDGGANPLSFQELGFQPVEIQRIDSLLKANEGLVLVTGPTGSGKTTTLYTAVRAIQSAGVNIVTVEDPVEYRLDGIAQVQTNEKAGLTFASVLRSILRQDPDVVLVGEIRDRETADVAIQAGMTGHLVLSTLHTNDAPGTIMRLAEMGVDIGALSSSIRGVMAQRLVRKVCTACRRPRDPDTLAAAQRALLGEQETIELYESVGCAACNGTGYRGRMVVPEIAVVTPAIERAVAQRVQYSELVELCCAAGMVTLWEAGIRRVVTGLTTLNELLDNISPPITLGDAPAATQPDVDAIFQQVKSTGPQLVTPPAAVPAPLPTASDSFRSDGMRVLLVDDDVESRRALRVGLEQEGFRVLEAADGEAALEYARRLKPEFIIMELALPKLDGMGVLRALAAGEIPPARALILTRQDDADLAVWAMELGAVDVMVKPVNPRILAQRLRVVLTAVAA